LKLLALPRADKFSAAGGPTARKLACDRVQTDSKAIEVTKVIIKKIGVYDAYVGPAMNSL
jgi:hypothetical protein